LHNNARRLVHDRNVNEERPSPRKVLADNLRALKDRHGWTQTEIADKADISQRYVSSVLSQEQDPTTEIVDGLAKAFGLPVWLLLVPELSVELLDSQEIPLLVRHFAGADPDGQSALTKLAQREFHLNPNRQKVVPLVKPKAS
jgi:transcriptional regulator with XRE-family HTH domain